MMVVLNSRIVFSEDPSPSNELVSSVPIQGKSRRHSFDVSLGGIQVQVTREQWTVPLGVHEVHVSIAIQTFPPIDIDICVFVLGIGY